MKWYLNENMSNLHLELDMNKRSVVLAIDRIYSQYRMGIVVIKVNNEAHVVVFDEKENAVAYLIDRLATSVEECVNVPNL